MPNSDSLDGTIDEFAQELEQTIQRAEQRLEKYPEYEGYNQRGEKVSRFFGSHPRNRQ